MVSRAGGTCAETQGGEKQENAKQSAQKGASLDDMLVTGNSTPILYACRDYARVGGSSMQW
jgi:hypothetical protein